MDTQDGYCKHRLAKATYRRAGELMRAPLPRISTALADAPALQQGVPPQHAVLIQGRPFMKLAGLLDMAHERGLLAPIAHRTYNDAELILARAVATFQDGCRFEASDDASPAQAPGQCVPALAHAEAEAA